MDAAETAFLDQIAATPNDRTSQLVYADWLAERNRPEELAWRWIAAFRRRPCVFRLFRLDHDPYWGVIGQKWLATDETPGGNGWGEWRWDAWVPSGVQWPWSAGLSMLPRELFVHLNKRTCHWDTRSGPERCYGDVKGAFLALVNAFMSATRPRRNWLDRKLNGSVWVPDWSLVNHVPDEE